ncbi:MAG: peptidase [Ignavibacteriales bacterium]|nr:peptidase [Ignavibacteriales bacterium]
MTILKSAFLFILIIMLIGCTEEVENGDKEMLQEKIDQFAEVEIKYDDSILDERQNIVVQKLYEAGKIIDELFLEQVYSKNFEIRDSLQKSDNEIDKLQLEYFNIMFGPWDRLDSDKPFIGLIEKPLGANFYPEDIAKEEFEQWIKEHPEDEKSFISEFTVIRRNKGKLIAIPYSEFYKEKLQQISKLLREAANYADNLSLKNYLNTRATGFETNDYYESDIAWMDLKNHLIEVVIGPYEVYEDGLFNYKAAFECFITIVDPEESKKLERFANYLIDIEKNLPYPDEMKNFDRGAESPIVVCNEVFCAGDSKSAQQTLAFNLPNDERVRKEKGSKKVMLKNIHEAKFDKLLYPIAAQVLDEEQLKYITFDAFFNHTLMHEISHGVGPAFIKVNGRDTEVKIELKEQYSKIEECKADILGIYTNIFMIEKDEYPKSLENELYCTFLAGIFRSVRFGVTSAHAIGNSIIYNYLLEFGGYEYDETNNRVKVNFDKIYEGVKSLANKVLILQATGDYEGTKALVEKYGIESESMKKLKDKLTDLPVDIKPIFQIGQQ